MSITLFLERYALWFAAGTTALLLIGCLILWLQRSPAHRQRTGELTILALMAWLLLAGLPLPRLLPEWHWQTPAIRPQSNLDITTHTSPAVLPAFVDLDASEELEAFEAIAAAREQSSSNGDVRLQAAEPVDSAREVPEHRPSFAVSIAGIYCAGVLVCLLWLIAGALRLWWIMFTAHRPPEWLASLYESIGPPASRARLLITRRDIRPLSCGLTQSVILLPRKLVRRRKAELLRMILLHEIAHVERRDGWGNALLCCALPWLYAHPLYWWLRRQYRMAAELLADSWAAHRAGTLPYVEQLVLLAGAVSPRAVPNAALAVFSSPSQFFRRMDMLMQRQVPLEMSISTRWRLMSTIVLAAIVWMGAEIAGSRPAVGQDAQKPGQQAQPETPQPAANKQNLPGTEKAPPQTPNLTEIDLDDDVDVFVRDAEIQVRKAPKAEANVTEAQLHAEIAAVELQLKVLRAKLEVLSGAKPAVEVGAGKFALQQTGSIIKLSRVGKDGAIIAEEWSVGRDGKPAKLLSKSIQVQAQDSPIASSNTEVAGGLVYKEYTRKDGSVVVHTYDSTTGKLIATREEESPAARSERRRGSAPEKPAPAQQAGSSDRDALGIDLIALAAAYADAVSDLEEAREDADGTGPSQAAFKRASRKERTLKAILTTTAETAHTNLDRTREMYQQGAVSHRALIEIETRCKMLDAILKSSAADSKGAPVEDQSPGKP